MKFNNAGAQGRDRGYIYSEPEFGRTRQVFY
ncbi:hypothetical protein DDB_G0283353 [Dictyostelium discoideum AX4]|uniref:Putative uncharacterized protein DDB_G0283353 n=1 Tax=Dictyostelium discoideum TaxID=44689 RepID=Y5463_DICDI|nr:hypothetical protein DDB_G0283353 [Dictyostelium discoideum AX4]Q54R75.2 RecName: Full=Putative uncharacterized protein DDB_G0283353 [Dictyostelium discoideum]EAL65753.2 hypothetical protein DDB_G0283353 [Dictyostelium discoideum AX4]|eukprot:XP_639108.2 hypothetical protein DDB_G0283353 [Dictyostelium discoideum AX4]